MDTTRKPTTVRLPEYMLADLHSEARKQGVSVSRLIERIAENHLYHPARETAQALEQCRNDDNLETLEPENMESYENFAKFVSDL